ncbi:MAG: MBL fold metallo-hydrolase [Myxococcales bacterium]|nr:MBL fold metallo-hydrolase [Myxococcales bacterium]
MKIEAQFDPATSTLSYVVYDPDTRDAVVIDPVLDFDPKWVQVSTTSTDRLVGFVRAQGLRVHAILDTHVHADHLSGAREVQRHLAAPVAIGAHIRTVQQAFREIYNWPDTFEADGSEFDRLLQDGEVLQLGSLRVEVMHTPGHTPACLTYRIGDALFTGDTLFMPDFGTGRCDFPGGSAEALYDSVQRLYALPESTRVFVGHDYQPGGRALRYETTIGAERATNKQLKAHTSREEFVAFRTARDATLSPPALILQSLQVNARGGHLPAAEDNGRRYLRMPLGVWPRPDPSGG